MVVPIQADGSVNVPAYAGADRVGKLITSGRLGLLIGAVLDSVIPTVPICGVGSWVR